MNTVIILILFAGGFFVGLSVGIITARLNDRPIGDLRIDESDPEDGPYLFLELNSGPDSIKNRTRVTLNVKTENFISQK